MELNFYLAFIITYKQYISLSFLMAMMFIFLDRTSRKPLGGFVVGLILIFGVRSGLYTELISFISKLQHFQVLVSLVVQYRELFSFLFFFFLDLFIDVFYVYWYFVYVYICIPDGDIRQVWTAMWVLGI